MTKSWQHCKNILIIRADNMGDLLMSGPAIRAVKQTFSARITGLTSSMAAGLVPFIPEIDDLIVFDLPWVKAKESAGGDQIFSLVQLLQEKNFDAAIIFTVFSQNPLPAAMIAYMAGIPLRLACCRENPYELLTDWLPDKEPYTFIQHQVQRDLALVAVAGAVTDDLYLRLDVSGCAIKTVTEKLTATGMNFQKPWLILHAGVSEKKREFPAERWIETAKNLVRENGYQVLFTGSIAERETCEMLAREASENTFSVAGLCRLEEFIALVQAAPVLVSVNTGTVHIAAAVQTPVVVLYAQTNPQHTPWMVPHKVLEFGVDKKSRSKNEVVQYLYKEIYSQPAPMPTVEEVCTAVNQLLAEVPAPSTVDLF